ncbi:MAG: hypothetical protein KatS3mg108_1804 [Isosphaeraceae bacterium]|jgi:hypothetical protein|nr:MAG: hypothetical protein KatS3mg108_1804 [Isosphaeraceae bacterium]
MSQGEPPLLPLVLWRVPPALPAMLAQEGVAFVELDDRPAALTQAGRFVVHDSRREPTSRLARLIAADQVLFDVDRLRSGWRNDPFAAWLDTRAALRCWKIGNNRLYERVNRHDRAALRHRVVDALRDWVIAQGGVWACLAPFPYPYRSAFCLRIDLDEPCEADYWPFASRRKPLDDCTSHFVSTAAYGQLPRVLDDLRQLDTHSHGHHHVVYRTPAANRRNLERADALLRAAGITPRGFAAPEGRWNPGLDDAIESLGYGFSSEFQVGYDDLPFFAWRGNGFSRVLQIPIHPLCEGLFLQAGARDGQAIADHLTAVIDSRVALGLPAFIYGHPEHRLGRFPEIVEAVARTVQHQTGLWRTTFGAFATWWRWRLARRWSLTRDDGTLCVTLANPSPEFTACLTIDRGGPTATIPLWKPRTWFRQEDLVYRGVRMLKEPSPRRPPPRLLRIRPLARACLECLVDWETVTPCHELPESTILQRWKKHLRGHRDRLAERRTARR